MNSQVAEMNNVFIDQNEVLRYLGYRQQKLEDGLKDLIAESIEETKSLIQPRVVYKFFDLQRETARLLIAGTNVILLGQGIANHLEEAKTCVLLAITLGMAIDRKINYYKKVNLTKALILDACASTAVEQVANALCAEIEAQLKLENQHLTTRFSPGYDDFPLAIQGHLLALLNAQRTIGLTVTEHNIMLPRKSITALAGVIELNQPKKKRSCINCSRFTDCQFRKERSVDGC